MKKFKLVTMMIILVSFSLLLSACGSGSDNKDKKSVAQEITYASTIKVAGLSPILTNDSASANAIENLYETLFKKNLDTGEFVPLLAESFENPDDNTWIIKLRQNVLFHDGTPFNAESVKYTFEKIKDPATAAPRASLLSPISSIEVLDEYTVVLKTATPYGPMLAALSHPNASIVSPTADKAQDLMVDPVGTGPFKFVKKENGDDIVLENNKDYWQKPSKIKKLTFKVVPEINTAISMMERGEVQFLYNVPSDSMARVEKISSLKVDKKKGTGVYYLVFNEKNAPMSDLNFRQAVANAVDYDGYINKLNGLGYRSKGFIGPEVFGYDASIEEKGIDFNLDKAKSLVKAGDYANKPVKLLVGNTPVYTHMGEVIQAQLTEAGLKVELETVEWVAYLDVLKKGEFDIALGAWSNVTADGSELLYPRLHSKSIGSSNSGHYSNETLDKLINESRETIDQDVRKAKLKEANEFVVKELPVVPIYHSYVNIVRHTSLDGIELFPFGGFNLYEAYRK